MTNLRLEQQQIPTTRILSSSSIFWARGGNFCVDFCMQSQARNKYHPLASTPCFATSTSTRVALFAVPALDDTAPDTSNSHSFSLHTLLEEFR
jgi:hypothetical protein